MSIATEIQRLQTAKSDLKTAIQAKGVTVPSSATIDTYDDYVLQISGGGGCEGFIGMIERSATAIAIPSGTTKIGENAFYQYSSLRSVNIPDTVTSIGNDAFGYCGGLSSVTIPDGVTSIGNNAFRFCYGLTSCTIGSGITRIGDASFYGCGRLTSATLGTSVTSIGNYAFYQCSSLTSITCLAATPPTLAKYGVFDGSTCPIYVPSASVNTYKAASSWSTYASRIQAIPNS